MLIYEITQTYPNSAFSLYSHGYAVVASLTHPLNPPPQAGDLRPPSMEIGKPKGCVKVYNTNLTNSSESLKIGNSHIVQIGLYGKGKQFFRIFFHKF